MSLRYWNVDGPGKDPASEYAAVVPRCALACLTGERPPIHGDGEQPTSVNDVLPSLAELTGVSPDPAFEPPREGRLRRTLEHLRATLEPGGD